MPSEKSGAIAIVTGAASGIGRAIARKLLRDGYHVAAVDRDVEGLNRLADEGRPEALTVFAEALDNSEKAIESIMDALQEADRPLWALVNNAGVEFHGSASETTLDQWEQVLTTNLTVPFLLSRHAIPRMIADGGGVVVNISSVAGLGAIPRRAAYCSSKFGLIGLTKSIAIDYALDNIRAVAICPGTIHTPHIDVVTAEASDPELAMERMVALQPVGRLGTPVEVADLTSYVISPDASYITGSAVVIDGGRTALA